MNTIHQQLDRSDGSYYTTLEVAKMLGMAVRSVQLMVDRGDLQAWKTPGGHRRITRESLERWLSGSRVRGAPGARPDGRRRPGLHPPRVLLIEDSTHFQGLVAKLVQQRYPSLELHISSNVIHGLIALGALQPDLLILDWDLPGTDSVHLLAELRGHVASRGCSLVVLAAREQQRQPCAPALQHVATVERQRLWQELPPLIEAALGLAPALGAQESEGAVHSLGDDARSGADAGVQPR